MDSATARGSSPICTKCSTPMYRPSRFSRTSTMSMFSNRPPARWSCRPHVGEQLEFLPEPDVHRAEPGAHRRRERPLEREPVLADALDGGVGQRRAGGIDRRHAGQLFVPVEPEAGGLEYLHRLRGDLRADPVARNQRGVVRHWSAGGSTAASARASAAEGVAPVPSQARQSTMPRAGVGRHQRKIGPHPAVGRAGETERRRHQDEPASDHRGEATKRSPQLIWHSLSFGARSMTGPSRRDRQSFPACAAPAAGAGRQPTSPRAPRAAKASPISGVGAQVSAARRSRYGAKRVSDSKRGIGGDQGERHHRDTCWPASPWVGTGSGGAVCAASGAASRSTSAHVGSKGRGTAGRQWKEAGSGKR